MEEKLKNELNERFDILEKYFHISKNIKKEFMKNGTVYYTEPNGALYWCNELGGGEQYEKLIKEFEEKHQGSKVYFAMHTFTEFGELLNLLFVSQYEEDWEYEKEDLKQGIAFSYVYNLDDDICSEFGSIGIRGIIGGLVRVA